MCCTMFDFSPRFLGAGVDFGRGGDWGLPLVGGLEVALTTSVLLFLATVMLRSYLSS